MTSDGGKLRLELTWGRSKEAKNSENHGQTGQFKVENEGKTAICGIPKLNCGARKKDQRWTLLRHWVIR